MKNKMLIGLCLIAATAEMGAVPVKTAIYNYLRSYIPGRTKTNLQPAYHIKIHATTAEGYDAIFHVNGDGQGNHTAQKTPKGTLILAIKPWEYIEISDGNIEGRYIIYDEEKKKHRCIKHLSDHPYILNPGRWAFGAVVAIVAIVAVAAKNS